MKREYKLYSQNILGNLHEMAVSVNRMGWAGYLIGFERSGNYTICIFKMPADMVRKIRNADKSYCAAATHDDVCYDPITLKRLT